jgi:hypothetical protein
MPDQKEQYGSQFKMYKGRKDGTGFASQFNLNTKSGAVYLEIACQSGKMDKDNNATFDWENKARFKLGISDIGEILAVLSGWQNGAGPIHPETGKHRGLFHQSAKGNAVLYFTKGNTTGFFMKLSIKREDDNRELQHNITNSEGMVLAILFRSAVEAIYRWY